MQRCYFVCAIFNAYTLAEDSGSDKCSEFHRIRHKWHYKHNRISRPSSARVFTASAPTEVSYTYFLFVCYLYLICSSVIFSFLQISDVTKITNSFSQSRNGFLNNKQIEIYQVKQNNYNNKKNDLNYKGVAEGAGKRERQDWHMCINK